MKRRALVCGLLLAGIARAQDVPGLARATATLRAGDYRQAVTLYDHVLAQYPGTVEARFQKGFALEKLGDTNGAIREYEAALRLDPKEVRVLNNLGFLLVDRAIDLPRGEKMIKLALKIAPDFAAAHDSLGWAEYHRKNYAQAEEHFRAALAKDPGNLSAYYHAGVMTLRRGDYTRAGMYLRKLVERDPRHVKGLIGLGTAYERLGQRDAARQTLARALSLVGRNSEQGQTILRLLNELGPYHPGSSLERFLTSGAEQTAASLEPQRPVSRRAVARAPEKGGPRIDFRKQAGEADPTPGEKRPARKLDPDLVRRHLELAKLYTQNELFKDAESELLTVINLEPGSDEAREARDLMSQVTEHGEVSQEARLAGYLKMGEALFARQADDEAKLQYQKVLLTDGTHPVANKALAFLHLRGGDLDRALTYVQKAIAREPRYLEALLIRGYIEARRRQFDRSCRTFDQVATLARRDSEVGRYASDMAERMKKFSTLE